MSGTKCIHCGEDCGKYPIIWEDKAFCCHGCETVYKLLNENKLYQYYEFENNPGIKIEQGDFGNKYAYLDNDEIKEKLIEFTDGEISKTTLFIPSIHCSSCIWLLEHLNRLNSGIIQSQVNFVKKEVVVTYREKLISLRQIVELLASIHYLPQITLEDFDRKKAKKTNRHLLYKIGIAGFAFGNIMLLSVPHYIPGKELIGENYKNFFAWLSLMLSIPVVVYCSNDYIITAFKNLKHRVININLPIAIGIITLFIQSAFEVINKAGPGYLDSLAGLVFFLLIGKWYQNKTYQALSFDRDYKSYFPVAVTRVNEGEEKSIPLKNIQIGDRILIRNRELIPADAILVAGDGLIDYSFVTGESRSIQKKPGDEVFAGGKQIGSAIVLEIRKKVEQSQLTKIWNQENTKNSENSGLNLLIDKVSQYFTAIIIIIALGTALFWVLHDASVAIRTATAVLIVACPCALALSMPFTFGNTMRLFGKNGLYLKKPEVIEGLTKVNTIVFDKTGTITQHGSMDVNFNGLPLTKEEESMIKSLCRQSTHPLSKSLYDAVESDRFWEIENFMEIPSSGIKGTINGIKIKIGSENFILGTRRQKKESSTVYVEIDGVFKGYYEIRNLYRKGLQETIHHLENKYELHVISGDHEGEKENLTKIFSDDDKLHFNMSPEDKLNYIKDLKLKGKNILMLGDGLNDAGALRESDVGISIADDVYQFSPACDAILEAEHFHTLTKYIDFSKQSLNVLKASFIISFIYNVVGLTFATQGLLSPVFAAILMPLSSVSVVAFATFFTSLLFRKSFKAK